MKNYMAAAPKPAAKPAAKPPSGMVSTSGADESGPNPTPTSAALPMGRASPPSPQMSGMERAMGQAADKLHPVGGRRGA